ncbi:MAG: hypothetical protein AAGI34_16510, partial [Pseudomonadota bacterium]
EELRQDTQTMAEAVAQSPGETVPNGEAKTAADRDGAKVVRIKEWVEKIVSGAAKGADVVSKFDKAWSVIEKRYPEIVEWLKSWFT